MSRPWELDPTYLEQTGLDPQQLWKQAAERNAAQATGQPANSASPSTPSFNPPTSSPSPPPNESASTGNSSGGRPEFWSLDPTYLEQTGLDPQHVKREIETAVRQSSASRTRGASSSPPPNRNATTTGGSTARRPEPWRLDYTYLERTGLDQEYVKREIDAAVRQTASRKLAVPSAPSETQTSLPDLSRMLDVSALALARRGSMPGGSKTDGQQTANAGAVPADYLLDQRNPINVVDRLKTAFDHLKSQLEQTVSKYSDVLQHSGGAVTMSPQLQGMVDRYRQAVDELNNLPKLESLLMMKLGDKALVVDADAGPPDLQLAPDKLKEWTEQAKRAKVTVVRSGGGIDIQFAPDVQSAVQAIDSFSAEVKELRDDYWRQVQDVIDKFNSSSGRFKVVIRDGKLDIDTSVHEEGFEKIKQLNAWYEEEVKKLMERYGAAVTVGKDGRPVITFTDPSKYGEFKAKFEALNKRYDDELGKIVKEHGLKVEGDKIVVDMSIYSGVFSEIDSINQRHNERLGDIYSRYGNILDKKTDESGRTVYVLRPDAQSALEIHNLVADITKAYNAMVRQNVQDVVGKYGDVLSYDPETGRVAPSRELAALLGRYEQAAQEVRKITDAMSTVAGMIPTFAQQLPVLTVKFETYDKAANKWVETDSETPIYVRDEKMREEIMRWMEQNKGKVKAAAFLGPGKPVVYVYNDRDEGYMIFPATGEARRARGVSGMVSDTANAIWYYSLTDEEKKKLEEWLEVQRRKEEIEQLPTGLRELYAALVGAGQFAVISPALDVLSRWLRGEDPTKGLEKFKIEAAAAAQASPAAYTVGQAVGFTGIAGLGAEALITRGATAGAQGVGRQFLTGLKSSLKPAVVGTAAGVTFGAVEGALTGRDPLVEAVKFGVTGLMTGLGGVTREQLIAGGLLGGVVGATTAKEHGVEKGLEAGSTVFFLPLAAPEWLARGALAGFTTAKRLDVKLQMESIPAADARYAQVVRELAAQIRSGMEKKPLPGLTPEEAAAVAAKLRAKPAEQREFFMQLAEDTVSRIRAGDDVASVQLKLLRDKLDPVSKMRLDEVLRQYGLTEVKLKTPEYALREEDALALARLFRREPEYALTDRSAELLDQFFRMRQEPEYVLTDAAAKKLNLFLRRTPEYALRDEDAAALAHIFKRDTQHAPEYQLTNEAAKLLGQFLKIPHETPTLRPATAEQQPTTQLLVKYKTRTKTAPEVQTVAERAVPTRRVELEALWQEPRLAPTAKTEFQLLARTSAEPKTAPEVQTVAERAVPTRRVELEALWQEPRLAPTAKTEVQLEVSRPLLEVQKSALVHALRPKVEAVSETALTPELRQIVVQIQETERRLAELSKPEVALAPTIQRAREVGQKPAKIAQLLKSPHGVLQLLKREPSEKERRPAIPILPTSHVEPPQYAKPPTYTPITPERISQYEVPTVPTSTTPTAANVPSPPTYPPVTVPKMGEVPTADVPTVPSREAPPPAESLPRRWWRLLPPHTFFSDRAGEGAYRAQEGKRQMLLLA